MEKLNKLKILLIKFLRGEAVKLALKNILGSAAASGFKAWLVKIIIKYFYDSVAEPIIKIGFRAAGYVYNNVDGKISATKLDEARNDNDEDTYDSIVTDILS
jgi:hypothetical protein